MLGDKCTEDVRSGAYELDRGVTSGQQDFETDEAQWPISKPVEKYEAKIQTAGEAEFVNDIPSVKGELNAAFVLSTVANCDIVGVDTTEALVNISSIRFCHLQQNFQTCSVQGWPYSQSGPGRCCYHICQPV